MNNSLKNSHIPGDAIQTNYKFTFIVHKYISYLMRIYTYRYIYIHIFIVTSGSSLPTCGRTPSLQ